MERNYNTYKSYFVTQEITSCGLLLGLPEKTVLHIIPVLKGFDSINEMRNLLRKNMFDQDLIEDLLFKVVVYMRIIILVGIESV